MGCAATRARCDSASTDGADSLSASQLATLSDNMRKWRETLRAAMRVADEEDKSTEHLYIVHPDLGANPFPFGQTYEIPSLVVPEKVRLVINGNVIVTGDVQIAFRAAVKLNPWAKLHVRGVIRAPDGHRLGGIIVNRGELM